MANFHWQEVRRFFVSTTNYSISLKMSILRRSNKIVCHLPENYLNAETELLQRIARGDEQAFARLFNNYRNKIYSTAVELIRNRQLAEEIVHDVFMIIWKRRDTLSDIRHFSAYLLTIARNEVYLAMKRTARFSNEQIGELDDTIFVNSEFSDPAIAGEYQRILAQAVEKLSPRQRQVYEMIREKEMRREEVAAALNISSETVKSNLADAMAAIRRFCLHYLKFFWWMLLLAKKYF